jgi:hypothetical protein
MCMIEALHNFMQWQKFTFSGGGGGGGQSLLNLQQNFQISDKPPHLHSRRLFLAFF